MTPQENQEKLLMEYNLFLRDYGKALLSWNFIIARMKACLMMHGKTNQATEAELKKIANIQSDARVIGKFRRLCDDDLHTRLSKMNKARGMLVHFIIGILDVYPSKSKGKMESIIMDPANVKRTREAIAEIISDMQIISQRLDDILDTFL